MSRRVQPAGSEAKRVVCVFDRRFPHSKVKEEWLDTRGLDLKGFLHDLSKTFSVPAQETFVIVTTERRVLDADQFSRLQNGATLYMLRMQDQKLEMPTEELINFTPHHDTVVESGTFKYYDSEGKKSLPYALADLVDNALTATANNTGVRTIEIQMLFDENPGKSAVIVLDNGCGMTSKQLNNWAVYKLSKFTRDSQGDEGGYIRPVHLPRSLNSDISYFGVGGKQAAFYIGKSTRMISKSVKSPDVHELLLSKSLFEKKEKNKEDTYSTTILNRGPGDFAHINKSQEQFLQDLIAQEYNKESFTAVVITEVLQEHINFFKEDFDVWTRQLAHIYHYYIHGPDGNTQQADPKGSSSDSVQISKLDILISIKAKNRESRVINLRDINTDMQSQYINAAVSTFEFKAFTNPDAGIVEGIIRYHPFLYDNETYPEDPDAKPDHVEDKEEAEADYINDNCVKKRKKPIFECFWNGRLIPYTTLSEFDWCSQPPKGSKLPPECYNRFSGVLFTDDTFKVTENKLTFIDLEKKLKNKDTVFNFVVKGQKQRSNLQRDFVQWLLDCHEKFDKQVKFMKYQGTITRTDIITKKRQHPWATFSSVEWHGKVYTTGQYVKTYKTLPIHYGTVKRFMFYGDPDCNEDVFAPGGQMEICLEPKGLYGCTKILPLSKLDRGATIGDIKKSIKLDFVKLPDKLVVKWPNENPWDDNSAQPAGNILGPIQVLIENKKGEPISRILSGGQGKKLSVELKLVYHASDGEVEFVSCVAQHSTTWGYWFKEIENFVELGQYTMFLNTVLSDTNATEYGERRLPQYKMRFTIKEGKAEQFNVGKVASALRIGVPFDIPLEMLDIYGHPVEPASDMAPTLECRGLDVTYEQVKREGSTLIIKNVTATGTLKNPLEPNPYNILMTVKGLKEHSKTLSVNMLSGRPHSIHVVPKDEPITVENGNTVKFSVIIQDEAGNATAFPKMVVNCQVPDHSLESINCATGIGNHMTQPINVAIVGGEPQHLTVQFNGPSRSNIKEVIRTLLVLPSKRAHRMELYKKDNDCLLLKNNEKIQWMAGGVLDNLYFKLYDEANEEVPVTTAMASLIKVNWTGNMNPKEIVKGKLPDVHVPTKVSEEHFYQVSYQDQSFSFSFTIIPIPDEDAGLKVTLPKCSARLGESLPEPINLELVDQYDNVTKTLIPSCVRQIKAEGEGLNKKQLKFTFQENSCCVLVTGVCFLAGTPGNREMNFTFRSFTCSVKLKVAAGVPAKLSLIHGPAQPLHILNGHCIPAPFTLQLCDKWDNPSPDQRVVVKIRPSPSELKVNANVSSQPVDANGQASFKVLCVRGPKGYYQLNFEGIFNKEPIEGPSVNLTILPDPNKPARLNVQYDTTVTFKAGELFPVFSVTVMSDEGSPITNFNPAAVSMLCWKGVLGGNTPPNTACEFQCSKPMENESKSSFYFREKPIPEVAGKYTVQFCLREPQKKLCMYSPQIILNVVANKPVRLAPDNPPPTQVVSHCEELSKRILLENLTLKIVDQCGNLAGQGLNGDVDICIKKMSGESTQQHPLFENMTDRLKVQLMDGKAHVERLAVMKNSPGEHGVTYVVIFKPLLSPEPSEPLESFEFQFSFSNDVQDQEKRVALSRKRETLKATIRKSTDEMNLRKNLLTEYNGLYKDSSENAKRIRANLEQRNVNLPENPSMAVIDDIIHNKSEELNQIELSPRRTCRLRNDFRDNREVLGMVCHLALVKDDAAAWVLSWHVRSDMKCVITTTTQAARRIFDMTKGNQEVMPIDGINAHCRNPFGPIPHIAKRFPASGNPVYAIDVLMFPQHKAECEIVFRNILGNTILIDDMDSANRYRQLVVESRMNCPTIITRRGEKITSKGKFGGAQNKAPPWNQLPCLFGAPLPDRYYILKEDIDLLNQYKRALEKKRQSEDKFNNERSSVLPKIKQAEEHLANMSRELEDTERQLETTVNPNKRVSPNPGTSGIPAKRARSGSTFEYR